ncbi:MAG TPA: PIN domain nuclease [Candidatus Omnitrophota bacterium]|nr:PIN domain nuclease [Candidatus Omnitrophota bacterium]HPD84777.1 PIN domain nuclease [Candidatus Omnitrophota bacterium]HRZ03635.1 PIN domain nuclease [Candidatus Omnitrophota bacterium]
MTLIFIRIFFLVIGGVVGYQIGLIGGQALWGIGIGLLVGLALIFLEANMRRVSLRGLSSMVFGLVLGMIMAKLITDILSLLPLGEVVHSILKVILTLVFSYLGAVMALRGKDEFNIIIPYVRFKRQDSREDLVILDTSAIIDGRIADIYKTKFFEARLVVPRFVLQELQHIADSDDTLKRQRGRRGMEILRSMQKDSNFDIKIHEDDMTGASDVDSKLVALAKMIEAKVCTTDFNLNRIAAIQGVKILNVNELANAVKSVVFAGEIMEVKLIKEGKEAEQAVAYMDDGTMIVVADARRMIGQKTKVEVTSVLQTQAGRMIFAKLSRQ